MKQSFARNVNIRSWREGVREILGERKGEGERRTGGREKIKNDGRLGESEGRWEVVVRQPDRSHFGGENRVDGRLTVLLSYKR